MSTKQKFWFVVLLLAALVVLIPLGLRWQAQWHLNAYRKKLIASGEKLTVEELAPKRDWRATNTVPFMRLASTLAYFGNFAPDAMLSIKPGVARVAWRQPQLTDKLDGNGMGVDVWPPLTDAALKNEQTFDELHSLLDAGGIELMEDYNRPIAYNGFIYLPTVKMLAIAFSARAILALHQGRMQDAFVYLKTCDAATQLTAKDPLEIDQLVSYACMNIAAGACWEALQAGGWTDDQLAQLQRQWERPNILTAAESSLAMERARGPMLFQLGRASRQGLRDNLVGGIRDNAEIWNDFFLHPRNVAGELLAAYPRYWGWKWIWSYQDEQRYLEFMQSMIDTMRDAQKRQGVLHLPALKIVVNNLEDREATANWDVDVVDPMKDMIRRFVLKALRAQTVEGIVRTAIALERYRLARHVYPKALRDLVPRLLHEVPVDGMDGHDLRYRLNPDGTYLLYSVGDDGVDDGGDPTPVQGGNFGFSHGRDWVWPRAATAEEVQAYEAKQDKQNAKIKR